MYQSDLKAGDQPRLTFESALSRMRIIHPQENVVVFGEGNPIGREFTFQPIMPIHVNLDLHGKPGLQFHVDQTKFPVHEVEVNKKAFPAGRPDQRAAFFKPKGKSPAWLGF
jgi:hypothetical protein